MDLVLVMKERFRDQSSELKSLHRMVAEAARLEGISLNQYILSCLERGLGVDQRLQVARATEERSIANHAHLEKWIAVLTQQIGTTHGALMPGLAGTSSERWAAVTPFGNIALAVTDSDPGFALSGNLGIVVGGGYARRS